MGFFHWEIVENYTVPGPPQRYGVSHPVFRPGMWDFSVVDNGIISEDPWELGNEGELEIVDLRMCFRS